MNSQRITSAVTELLKAIEGEELRAELEETPRRVQRALEEMLDGYDVDISTLFKVSEGEGQDQMVAVTNIGFTSFCSHHLLPWMGVAHVGYLPTSKVIGVSKMGRLVLAFAHRLILQERLTKDIAYTLMENLNPQGVAVIIIGEHSCMRYRGVKLPTSQVRTSEMIGEFRDDAAMRQEFLSLVGLR